MTVRIEYISEQIRTEVSLDEALTRLGFGDGSKEDFLAQEYGMEVSQAEVPGGGCSFTTCEGGLDLKRWITFFRILAPVMAIGCHLCFAADEGVGLMFVGKDGFLQGGSAINALRRGCTDSGWPS